MSSPSLDLVVLVVARAEWISGSPSLNTSHWLYTYVYLLFFNGLCVFALLLLPLLPRHARSREPG